MQLCGKRRWAVTAEAGYLPGGAIAQARIHFPLLLQAQTRRLRAPSYIPFVLPPALRGSYRFAAPPMWQRWARAPGPEELLLHRRPRWHRRSLLLPSREPWESE